MRDMHGRELPESKKRPWAESFLTWYGYYDHPKDPLVKSAVPLEIQIGDGQYNAADFWVRERVEEWTAELREQRRERGHIIAPVVSNVGTRRTAELLVRAAGDEERVSAVLLGAALWSGLNPRSGRTFACGATDTFANNVLWGVREFIEEWGYAWRYPMGYALPVVPDFTREQMAFTSEDDVIMFAKLCAMYALHGFCAVHIR